MPVEEFAMSGKLEQVQSTGKNLVSVPDIEAGSGQRSVKCLLEKDVYISCYESTAKVSGNIWRIRIGYKDGSFKYLTDSQMETGSKFTCSTENPIIEISPRGLNVESGAYRKIQVEYGSVKTSYEPYTGGKPTPSPDNPQPIVTTPQGIITVDFTDGTNHQIVELSCPREFTKWDRLEKIDGIWNWMFGSKRILLTENEQWNYTNKNEDIYFSIVLNDSYGGKQSSLCRGFKNVNIAYDNSHKDELGIYCDHPTVGMEHKYFRKPNETIQTLEQWKTWLTENPIEILYKTKEPELIPLSPSEQDKLNALTMYAPNTEIANTGGCSMELTYTVDTKAYVDAKILTLSKALL